MSWIDDNLDTAVKDLYDVGIDLWSRKKIEFRRPKRKHNSPKHFQGNYSELKFVEGEGRIVLRKRPNNRWGSSQKTFKNDFKVHDKLQHLNCVPNIVGSDFENDFYFDVEPIWGVNLREFMGYIKKNNIDPLDYISLLVSLTERLHNLYIEGVIWRDMKPDNILLRGLNDPVLIDFGLGIYENYPYEKNEGQPCGTPTYMSPEQARGVVGSIDHRSDVYSLGCIMYELLSGRKVFETNSPWYCIYQKIEEIPDSLNKIIDISDGLNDIVMKCLEKDPDNRYQTAAEVAFDLGMVGI